MRDMKELVKDHYLRYASYVILDRAIPDLADGLKPVQRRILHTLFKMHDSKFHKVANVVGQTMAFHPHGDAPIYEALVTLANKGMLLDCQGNFGNPLTGDPAAAARYIETRLSKLALETMFHPRLTQFVPSYDGRHEEPVVLPSKLPLLLLQGAEGIAVGMSTKIFPHNFREILTAQIHAIKKKPFSLYPDFHTGGVMDASEYDDGRGKVRVRAKIEAVDQKTIVIREICPSTTTESVIASIEEATKKGKIKLESINDYTAEHVEIEIRLPRGTYAKDIIEQLYAFTECEVSLSSQIVVIADGTPKEISVSEAVHFYAERLQIFLRSELELELSDLMDRLFERTLERIFIEEKIYQTIEDVASLPEVYDVLFSAFSPFQKTLLKKPTKEDIDRLLSIPIRRIARFDLEANRQECQQLEEKKLIVSKSLQDIPAYTIRYIEGLIKRYGSNFPRKTELQELDVLDRKQLSKKDVEVGVDRRGGYVGLKVTNAETLSCSNIDRILVLLTDGTYKVYPIADRTYVGKPGVSVAWCGVADKQQVLTCCYRDPKSGISFCKRFIVKQFILEKEYRWIEEGFELLHVSPQASPLFAHLVPKSRQRVSTVEINVERIAIHGAQARGIRISPRPVLSVKTKASL